MNQTVIRLGALARWRSEIRSGLRKNDMVHFDDLQAAACNELVALEEQHRGDLGHARRFMDRALLRLHGCYHDPSDGTEKEPGPGRLMLRRLTAEHRELGKEAAAVAAEHQKNPWSRVKPTQAAKWPAP